MGVARQAAVSSFGFSGTNAHLVVREAAELAARHADRLAAYLVVLSAQTEEALTRKVAELGAWLEGAESEVRLRDIAYTLQLGRSQFSERLAVVAETVAELVEKLRAVGRGEEVTGVYRGRLETARKGNDAGGRSSELFGALSEVTGADYVATLERLAEVYAAGGEARWEELYQAEDHRRLSLPTYPFARDYFWVPKPAGVSQDAEPLLASKLHPLIDRNASSFAEQRFTTRLTGHEFFLSDHLINNRKVLPGVSYLEIARAAGELSGGKRVASLRNIVWTQPFTLDTDSREISISLRQAPHAVTFDIWTTNEEQLRVVHSQGELVYDDGSVKLPARTVNIGTIRERCERVISGESCYEVFDSLGFNYGPSFRVIEELAYGGTEVLARLELPAIRSHELSDFDLHPSILDGALQSCLWLMDIERVAETRYLPFAVGEVRITGTLSSVCFVHVTESSRRSNVIKLNIRIVDESGQLVVEILDYSARAQRQAEAEAVLPEPAISSVLPVLVSDEAIADLFKQLEAGELDVTKAHQLIQHIEQFV